MLRKALHYHRKRNTISLMPIKLEAFLIGDKMKPLGQKPHKQNFTDVHPHDGHINWWEVEGCDENKAASKRGAEKEIREQLDEQS